MVVITGKMMEHLLNSKERKNLSEFNDRLVKQATQGIRDITFLSLALPESEQGRIFNEENLHLLFRGLFRAYDMPDRKYLLNLLFDQLNSRKQNRKKLGKMLESLAIEGTKVDKGHVVEGELSNEKRLRMLKLCDCALSEIATRRNVARLAPNAWNTLKQMRSSSDEEIYGTKYVRAIRIEAFSSAARTVIQQQESKNGRASDRHSSRRTTGCISQSKHVLNTKGSE